MNAFVKFFQNENASEHGAESALSQGSDAVLSSTASSSESSSSFMLPNWNPPVQVQLPAGLTAGRLLGFKAFMDWQACLKESLEEQRHGYHPFHKMPFRLAAITVKSFSTVDRYGTEPNGRILFVKLMAHIVNDKNETLPGVVFLRGGSVTVLMILRPSDALDEKYVIMTEQARVAAGSLRFQELPAGMLDDENNFVGAAAREIEEEVRLRINPAELIDMTELALKNNHDDDMEEPLQKAMYPSPGTCDEFISICLWEQEMARVEIEDLQDRLTGVRAEQEHIRVRLMKYEQLPQIGTRDAKTLAAWSLYEYLKRTRLLDDHKHRM